MSETAASPLEREDNRARCVTLLHRLGIRGTAALKLAARSDCQPDRIKLMIEAAGWLQRQGTLKKSPAAYVTWALKTDDWRPPGEMP